MAVKISKERLRRRCRIAGCDPGLPRLEAPGAGSPRHCVAGSCWCAAATVMLLSCVVRLLRHTDLLDRHWRRSCLDFDTRSKGNGGFFLSAYYEMPSFGFDATRISLWKWCRYKGGQVRDAAVLNRVIEPDSRDNISQCLESVAKFSAKPGHIP